MNDHARALREHAEDDKRGFAEIRSMFSELKDNHLAHIEPDMASMKTDIEWLKWGVLAIIGGIIMVYFKG